MNSSINSSMNSNNYIRKKTQTLIDKQDKPLLIVFPKTYEWYIKEHLIINSHIIYEEKLLLGKKLIENYFS